MKNIFAKAGEQIEVKPVNNQIDNYEMESLKSNLVDRMIDSLEQYLNDVANNEKIKSKFYLSCECDYKIMMEAFDEFMEIIDSNNDYISVIGNMKNSTLSYQFDSNKKELLYYCYLMALKEKYEMSSEKKVNTLTRIPSGMAPHKPYRCR